MLGALVLKDKGNLKPKVFLGVAYDLEGTVINLEPFHHRAHREVANILGISLPEKADELIEVAPSFYGGPDRAIYEEFLKLARLQGVSEEVFTEWPVEKLLEVKDALFDGMFKTAQFEPRPNVARSMQMVESLGVPFCICSVTRSLQAQEIIRRSGLSGYMSSRPILLRHHVKHGKPAPDVYLKAAEQMGTAPKNLLVFEDSPTGVKAGVAAGATVLAVPASEPNDRVKEHLLKLGATKVFDNWKEVNDFLEKNACLYLEEVKAKGEEKGKLIKAFGGRSLVE